MSAGDDKESQKNLFDFDTDRYDADIQTLLTAVYHRCRIQVSMDDPIIAWYYVTCFCAGRFEESMRQMQSNILSQTTINIEQFHADAFKTADKIVNAGIEGSKNLVVSALKDASDHIRQEAVAALEPVKAQREAMMKDLKTVEIGGAEVLKMAKMALYASFGAAACGLVAVVLFCLNL